MTEHEENRELTPDEMKTDPDSASSRDASSRDDLDPAQMTTWDGAGNPMPHVFANDEDGRLDEGLGETADKALTDARDTDTSRGV